MPRNPGNPRRKNPLREPYVLGRILDFMRTEGAKASTNTRLKKLAWDEFKIFVTVNQVTAMIRDEGIDRAGTHKGMVYKPRAPFEHAFRPPSAFAEAQGALPREHRPAVHEPLPKPDATVLVGETMTPTPTQPPAARPPTPSLVDTLQIVLPSGYGHDPRPIIHRPVETLSAPLGDGVLLPIVSALPLPPRRSKGCQWPDMVCADPVDAGRPYCNAHCRRAFVGYRGPRVAA
jgi:hypothetical protein